MIKIFNPTRRPVDVRVKKLCQQYGSKLDLIISYGGDGTLLGAERQYPNIPKLPIRSSQVCNMCYAVDSLESILKSILKKDIKPTSFIKLEAIFKTKKLLALNEVSIGSKLPNSALRFSFKVNQVEHKGIIADGLIISTPFGSTGYFKSVSRTIFQQGIGIVVNNPVSPTITNIVVDTSLIEITIDRQDAILYVDNNPNIYTLKPSSKIIINKSSCPALIY